MVTFQSTFLRQKGGFFFQITQVTPEQIMDKTDLKVRAFVSPTPTVIASAYDENGRADACTLAFVMMSSHFPPCVTIAINATAQRKTLKSILHSGAFVVGYPSTDQVIAADYLGVETGYHADKLKTLGYTTTKAKCVDAPVIDQLKLSLECKVVHTVTVGSHTQITGEIKNIQADREIVDAQGKVMMDKLAPIIYNEEAFTYHKLGECIADAFKTGAAFKKDLMTK